MSGYLTPESTKFLLDALVGKALPWSGNRSVYVGLATKVPETNNKTLANITECSDANYTRVEVAWDAATVLNPDFDPVQVFNSEVTDFPAVAADMPPAPYAFLTDVASGSAIGVPVLTKGTTGTTGGTFAAGTFTWYVTATNSRGETAASNSVSATLVSGGKQVLNWAAISGATGYKVYREDSSGSVLVATLGTVTTYEDTGTAGTSAAVPTVNSAAVGAILYIWELAEPISALAGKPIRIPAHGLVIE